MKSKLIIVGGFLGAGKTSLLWETAKLIKDKGESVGLITNDQATELVDTTFLETSSHLVKEVSGSCFCCNFNGFADAITYISNKNNGGIIIAEPVGSCTDLSATLMQPLKDKYSNSIDLAPLTVLADPYKLKAILDGVTSSATYIISKQFEEADIILINKTDLISKDELLNLIKLSSEKWGKSKVMTISVKNGEGLEEWYQEVLQSKDVGAKIAEVDYDIYADGEAAYGWLNATFSLDNSINDYSETASVFLNNLSSRFDNINVNVGHIKFLLQSKEKLIIGNITGDAETASIREYNNNNYEDVSLTVNARVEIAPDQLENVILKEVDNVFRQYNYSHISSKCLIPGRPNPTYRYKDVIEKN